MASPCEDGELCNKCRCMGKMIDTSNTVGFPWVHNGKNVCKSTLRWRDERRNLPLWAKGSGLHWVKRSTSNGVLAVNFVFVYPMHIPPDDHQKCCKSYYRKDIHIQKETWEHQLSQYWKQWCNSASSKLRSRADEGITLNHFLPWGIEVEGARIQLDVDQSPRTEECHRTLDQ